LLGRSDQLLGDGAFPSITINLENALRSVAFERDYFFADADCGEESGCGI